MPTFEQCLDAEPAELDLLRKAVEQAVTRLRRLGADYDRIVSGLASTWEGADYDGLVGWAGHVNAYLSRSDIALVACAQSLAANGSGLTGVIARMKAAVAAAETAGYLVASGPAVTIGPAHLSRLAAAGTAAPMLLAAFRSEAAAYSAALAAAYAEAVAFDVIGSAAISVALHLPAPEAEPPEALLAFQHPGPFEHASAEDLERVAARVRSALGGAGIARWEQHPDNDVDNVHVEIDDLDGGRGVYVSWNPAAHWRERPITQAGAHFEASVARVREVLRANGIEAEETDPDFNPFTLEVLAVYAVHH